MVHLSGPELQILTIVWLPVEDGFTAKQYAARYGERYAHVKAARRIARCIGPRQVDGAALTLAKDGSVKRQEVFVVKIGEASLLLVMESGMARNADWRAFAAMLASMNIGV